MRTLLVAFRNRFTLFTLALLLGSQAWAGTVYTVNRSIGATGSVKGTIETDGTLGVLSSSNIVNWSLTISDDQVNFLSLDGPSNTHMQVTGDFLSATDHGLFFDFSGHDSHVLFKSTIPGGPMAWWCIESLSGGCAYWSGAESVVHDSVDPQRTINLQGLVQIAGIQGGGGQVPEPATLPMAAAAGMLALGLRRKRR